MTGLRLCIPLLLTALVRYAWLSLFPTDPISPIDAEGFHLLAVNLLDGRGFAIGWAAPFCPTAVRTPLYPWFVAAVYSALGRDPHRVVAVQILLEVIATAGTMALTRDLARTACRGAATMPRQRRSVFLVGMLYALNGTTQRFTGYLLSEALLLPLLPLALLATLRTMSRRSRLSAFAAGATWATILLAKPNAQYLVCAVGALLLVTGVLDRHRCRTGSWGAVLTFLVVLALALMPWLVRNRLLLGRWTLSTAFEENIARVSAVATEATLRGLEIEPWSETWEHLYDALELRAVPELANVSVKTSAPCRLQLDWQRRIAAEARTLVLANLGTYLRAHVKGVARSLMAPGHRLWYHVVTGRDWAETGTVPDVWQRMGWSLRRWAVGDACRVFWLERIWRIPPAAGALWWGLMMGRLAVMALTGLGLSRLRGSVSVMLLLAGTIAYHLVLPGPISHDRFYVPIVPVVVAVVSLGLAGISLWVPAGYNELGAHALPLHDAAHLGGHHDRGHA